MACRHELALRNIVMAWKSLKGGEYRPAVIDHWLNEVMKPSIDDARRLLKDPPP